MIKLLYRVRKGIFILGKPTNRMMRLAPWLLLLMMSTAAAEPAHVDDTSTDAAAEQRVEEQGGPAARHVDEAIAFERADRVNDAIDQYREALALNPSFLPARVNLVTLYSRQNNTAQAQQLLESGLALSDTPPRDRGHLAYLLALSLAEQGEFEVALKWLDRDNKWRPDHARTYYNQALLLDRLGRKEEALDALHKGLYLTPESPDLLYAAVYLNATQGNVAQALAVIEQLRRITPDDPKLGQLEQQLKGHSP